MVNRSLAWTLLVFGALLTAQCLAIASFANAQTIQYHLEHEYALVWVNQDGTIDLTYDISIASDLGTINFVNVGQPNDDFEIGAATDYAGHTLTATDAGNSRVRVDLHTAISTGQTARFTLVTNVGHMIWEDTDNPGNVGMQFTPVWWDAEVDEIRILVILPEGVTADNIRNTPDWDNAYHDPDRDNRFVVYWERHNLQPNEQFSIGVSFPKEFVQHYETRGGLGELEWLFPIAALIAASIAIGAVVYKRIPLRKYETPSMRMETLGIRHGLTAVEASQLLELPPTKIVTAILYSLLRKKAVWVTATSPAINISIEDVFKDMTGTPETPLRYYEKSFLEAVRKDGTLDEAKLAKTVMLVRTTLEEKLKGYCRKDTIDYYERIVNQAWEEVEQAGTSDLASKTYDENLLWLILHKGVGPRTEDAFRGKTFEPEINWWWFWYVHTLRAPQPAPTSTTPPTIPGAEFANNIATSLEQTANTIVADVERFTNSIVPAQPPSSKTSHEPTHHKSSCVCACASCACVCACVSCACACASGGVG